MPHFSLSFEPSVKRESTPLVLRCLLDRFPIIIYGEDSSLLDDLACVLIKFLPNRQERIFWVDFATSEEYSSILDKERQDTESPRSVIRVPCLASKHAFNGYTDFQGWIIPVSKASSSFSECIDYVKSHNPRFLLINICGESKKTELVTTGANPDLDLSFERDLITRIEEESFVSLEKVKRVLKKKVYGSNISHSFSSTLLNFDVEKINLQESLFNSQIFMFVNACKRALYLLTRLNLITQFNIEGTISEKTLLDTIQFQKASGSRILDFIYSEWGLRFHDHIRRGKLSALGDIIDGLWG